jgi:hypothetical protein
MSVLVDLLVIYFLSLFWDIELFCGFIFFSSISSLDGIEDIQRCFIGGSVLRQNKLVSEASG